MICQLSEKKNGFFIAWKVRSKGDLNLPLLFITSVHVLMWERKQIYTYFLQV